MSKKQLKKLEDSKLWQNTKRIADYVYSLHEQLPRDEKLETQYKFRGRAFDLTGYIAEAEAAVNPRDVEYDLAQARRAIFSVRNAYRYLVDREIIELDPAFMLKLDGLLADIDELLQQTWEKMKAAEQEPKK